MVWDMQKFAEESPSPRARAHMVFLKGTYLVETDAWDSEIAGIEVDTEDLNISVRSQFHFLDGMKAFMSNDREKLDGAVDRIQNDINRENFVVKEGSTKLCSNVSRADASQMDITEAEVRKAQLEGLAAWLDDDAEKTEMHMLRSIELFESISYSYGPPHVQKPVRELYADWLVDQGRTEEAKEQYELTLKIGPKRLRPTLAMERL